MESTMGKASGMRSRGYRYAGMALLVLAALLFLVRGSGCLPWNRNAATVAVRVTVTRDFGGEVLRDEGVEMREGASAMMALREAAEVRTSYGGGFIDSVDGLASAYGSWSSAKRDWFFYLNGQLAHVGAGEMEVRDGDWVLFDYHAWDYSMFTPAFAGCFPEPFVHGYERPPEEIQVLFAPGWEEGARRVVDTLLAAGASGCAVGGLSPHWRPRAGEYAIVLGTARELEGNAFLAEANAGAVRLGLTAYFHEGELLLVGEGGEIAERLSSQAGLVGAVGPRLGGGDAALLVSGTDRQGVEAALTALTAWDNTRSSPSMVMVIRAGEAGSGRGGGAH